LTTPETGTGSTRSFRVPSPSWPVELAPQAKTVPFARRPRLWEPPPATAVAPDRLLTCTGSARGSVDPSPTWPLPLRPQPNGVPGAYARPGTAGVATGPATAPGGGAVSGDASSATATRIPSNGAPSCAFRLVLMLIR